MIIRLFFILICYGTIAFGEDLPIKSYINKLLTDVFAVINDDQTSEQVKISKTREMLKDNLDLPWMSKAVLGRSYRTISPDQFLKFKNVYSSYLVHSYSQAVKKYDGQRVHVNRDVQLSDDTFIVKTSIITKKDPLKGFNLDYMVHKVTPSKFKVFDVITEEISLIRTQRSEFNGILKNEGFDKLIQLLQNKLPKAN